MQKVLLRSEIDSTEGLIGKDILEYINRYETETFEGYEEYSIIAFDWYDTSEPDSPVSQIMIFADRDDLLFICEDERTYKLSQFLMRPAPQNSRTLYGFFSRLLGNDMAHLENIESRINSTEEKLMTGADRSCIMDILDFRYELFDLKRYYQQLVSVFECLEENDNELFEESSLRYFSILLNRANRLFERTVSLQDYVSQVREAYQSQIDIEQNKLMRVFTVITAVFLPLTLLVGWYGMNFKYMPELASRYSYPIFTAVCIGIVAVLIIVFKKRKWF